MTENPPYSFSPITDRAFELPNNTHIAFIVMPNIEYYRFNDQGSSDDADDVLDTRSFSRHEYGIRVGIWRLLELFDKHDVRVSAALNSQLCDYAPEIIDAGLTQNWEFMGHGITNSVRLTGKTKTEEREIICQTRDQIQDSIGSAPTGWLSPGLMETQYTLEILADEGFEYVLDWCNDELPYSVDLGDNTIISIPLAIEISDFQLLRLRNLTGRQFEEALRDHFDTLFHECQQNDTARVMTMGVHPDIVGHPQFSPYFDNFLQYILHHRGVWNCTGSELARYYRTEYE